MKKSYCYIHIPFCESKCKYCRFASVWSIQKIKIKKYLEKLITDINNSDKKINRLKSIYFWWWTPSTLSIPDLELIINNLKDKFWFENNIEITLETTPNKVSQENIIWWKGIWINRISIWVQTLNNDSLIEIWRGNKWDTIGALDNIKKIWFNNVSIDFIIWLPHVKKWETKKDIEYILDNYLFVKHISVYMLEDHYYPWNWKEVSISEDDFLWEYIEIKNFLEKKWFNRYEISNFACDWCDCSHNKAYWDHSDILAFGLWSHWFFDNERYSYSDKFEEFYNDIIIKEKLNENDTFLEKVMFWLRTSWLEKNIYEKLDNKKIQELVNSWYLRIENWVLSLENKGVLVQDFILGEII